MTRRARQWIDREDELARIASLAADGWAWIALVGPAGVGKSALGAEAARALALPVVQVSLDGVGTLRDALAAIAVELSLGDPSEAGLGAALRARSPCALVLDDADGLLAELAPAIARLAESAPELLVLSLSRRRPAHASALVLEIAPLALPRDADDSDAPAIALFAARVSAQRGGRALDPSEREIAAAIARRVDGLPLALELLAARAALLGLAVVLEELERGGACMLDELLETQLAGLEPALHDALVALCALGDEVDPGEAAMRMGTSFEVATERLHGLRERSLAHAHAGRFRVLSPVQSYVRRRSPEGRRGVLARIARHWAEQVSREPDGETLAEALRVRGASLRALADAPREVDEQVAVVWSALARTSWTAGAWLADALAPLAERTQGAALALRCDVEHALAEVLLHTGELDAALDASDRTRAFARELGDSARLARALRQRAVVAIQKGDLASAETSATEAIGLARGLSLPRLEGACAQMAARVALRRGEHVRALALYQQSLELHRLAGDRRFEGLALAELGMLHLDRGELEQAAACATAMAGLETHDAAVPALATGLSAAIEHDRGALDRALAGYEDAARRAEATGMSHYASMCRAYRGTILIERGEVAAARSALSSEAARQRSMGDSAHAALFDACAALAEAHLDARPARLEAHPSSGERWLDAALAVLAGSAAPDAHAHFDSRVALRLRRRLDRPSSAPRPSELRIERGAFVTPHGRVDTRRRGAMRNLLLALAEHPGDAMAAEALIAAGWPGERILPEAARNRLHVTLHRLRELGLRDMLVADDGGWSLDAAVRVVREE